MRAGGRSRSAVVASTTGPDPGVARPLRIVHAVRSDAFAGVERYVTLVAKELARLGHQLAVVGGNADRMPRELGDIEWRPAATTAEVFSELRSAAQRADVVHAHMTAAEFAASVNPALRKIPLVATRHFAANRGSGKAGRAVARIIERRLAVEIAVSDFVAGTVGRPCVTLMNGVDRRPQVALDNRVVLAVQRLEAEKRTAELIRAWPLTGLAERGWELWIAGTGSERAGLESLAANADGIRLLGHRGDVPELHRRAAMFVATAPAEPFGLSVAEAMASGLPTVASSGGGHLETVGRARPDLLYESGDEEQLAADRKRHV